MAGKKSKEDYTFKKKCPHRWDPVLADVEKSYVFYRCILCEELRWKQLERIKHKDIRI